MSSLPSSWWRTPASKRRRDSSGLRLLIWYTAACAPKNAARAAWCTTLSGKKRRSRGDTRSSRGMVSTYVGERCSMVMCAALSAMEGTSVTAVAPEPMTTTRLPV
jgi:hypothetical protein